MISTYGGTTQWPAVRLIPENSRGGHFQHVRYHFRRLRLYCAATAQIQDAVVLVPRKFYLQPMHGQSLFFQQCLEIHLGISFVRKSAPDTRLCQLFIQQIQVLRSYIHQFHMSYSRKDALHVIPVPCQR